MTGVPVLVTGMPRSGNTWLARLLATGARTALPGREPMNPRGRQYALAHTLTGWASLDTLTPRQSRALRSCYQGVNPMVYSRYGRRQWTGPLPGTRNIIKDPFAMLSMPRIVENTGAAVVLVYRHPGAALASYRRMGWQPDLAELQVVVEQRRRQGRDPMPVVDLPREGAMSEPQAMGLFWAALYRMALNDARRVPGLLVASHGAIAGGGEPAARQLFSRLGLRWTNRSTAVLGSEALSRAWTEQPDRQTNLHNFDRNPREVASSWRAHLEPTEIEQIEAVTAEVRADLAAVSGDRTSAPS